MTNRLRAILLVAAATSSGAVLAACGSGGVSVVNDFNDVEVGQHVSVDGVLSLRGSTPFTTLVVQMENGTVVAIDSDDDAMMTELRGLTGLTCEVRGKVVTPMTPGTAEIKATSYEVLPLPTGELPIVGLLSSEGDQCVLTTTKGKRYWIRGKLAGAIREYIGARIWIVGDRTDTDAPDRPRKSTPFTPTGYGVLDEAPAH
jgi:hypothetical protein